MCHTGLVKHIIFIVKPWNMEILSAIKYNKVCMSSLDRLDKYPASREEVMNVTHSLKKKSIFLASDIFSAAQTYSTISNMKGKDETEVMDNGQPEEADSK